MARSILGATRSGPASRSVAPVIRALVRPAPQFGPTWYVALPPVRDVRLQGAHAAERYGDRGSPPARDRVGGLEPTLSRRRPEIFTEGSASRPRNTPMSAL